ncbi:MAG: septal ring lytic transglycosylase RlpA family protein [Pseudomonadota bacterium]|nr:septal ring lytic transglycosylase RlpA family protein [Pseudomonadota bacterium]
MPRHAASGLYPFAAAAIALTLVPAAEADRKHPAPIEYVSWGQGGSNTQTWAPNQTRSVPKPNSQATQDSWRGPVTKTGSVGLPAEREKVNFAYPGTQRAEPSTNRQYASVEPSPRASLPQQPSKLWPAEATASPLEASKAPAVQTLTLGGNSVAATVPTEVSKPVTPNASGVLHEERGLASWYGEAFHGQPTANGEIFDMDAMTAAHRTLPLPSLVQVVNESNGKEIVVRINDRGPFEGGRIIDLSRKAAAALDIKEQGEAPVVVRYLGPAPAVDAVQMAGRSPTAPAAQQQASVQEASSRMSRPDLYGDMLLGGMEPSLGVPDPGNSVATPARLASAPATPTVSSDRIIEASLPPVQAYQPATPAVRKVSASPVYTGASPSHSFNPGIYVQIGAFADIGNAQGRHAQVGGMFPVSVEDVKMNGADYFRVLVGPFPTRDAAERARVQMQANGIGESFVALR